MSHEEQDLRYYLDELSYLRQEGREFARRYPALGSRLELAAGRPADPHVERLIESFAFLTARLQRRIDAEFPEVSSALLSVLYPQLATIVPPLAIACFEPDLDRAKWTEGFTLEAGTALFARNHEGVPCRFETCYPLTLWPIRVTGAFAEPPAQYSWLSRYPAVASAIRVRLECPDPGFHALPLDRLRFHIDGDAEHCAGLYDLLAASTVGLAVQSASPMEQSTPAMLPPSHFQPVGFDPEEAVFPSPPPAHAGYRLIQEYFHFPRKFLFFDFRFSPSALKGHAADLLILLDRRIPDSLRITAGSFRLGCTPVVNLFPQTSEPIRIDHRHFEYRLVPDHRRETTTEVHSIVTVSSSSNPADRSRRIEPFYSLRQHETGSGSDPAPDRARSFWHARRSWRSQAGVPGTDVHLSFFDRDLKPSRPPTETVFAHLLCTNRGLARELPAGAHLDLDRFAPVRQVRCLDKPTAAGYPALGGASLWRLVSSLTLGHLSLGGSQGLDALRQILMLYCPEDRPALRRQVAGIVGMDSRPVIRRVGADGWRGFRQGAAITLTLDAEGDRFAGASRAVLSGVLRSFLSLHAGINSFTELAVRLNGEQEDWLRWPPLAGARHTF